VAELTTPLKPSNLAGKPALYSVDAPGRVVDHQFGEGECKPSETIDGQPDASRMNQNRAHAKHDGCRSLGIILDSS
jgi:hypothetical protein